MTTELDIHVASSDELVAAHRNVFDIWSKGLSLEDHVQSRLDSPKHRLATWYVGCVGVRVVVSLGCYPLRFQIRGKPVPGMAIGSVYTVDAFRRRGYAARLLAWAERHQQEQGAVLSLLYSDINPEYYARLGYVRCPSFEGWRDLQAGRDDSGIAQPLFEINAESQLDSLMRLYDSHHRAVSLSIARDALYWRALLQRFPEDQFFALAGQGSDDWVGFVRLGQKDGDWRMTDYALADRSDAQADGLYRSTAALAASRGGQRVGGWLPEDTATRSFFELVPRSKEITMLKSLANAYPLDDEMIAATVHFREIDHV